MQNTRKCSLDLLFNSNLNNEQLSQIENMKDGENSIFELDNFPDTLLTKRNSSDHFPDPLQSNQYPYSVIENAIIQLLLKER